MLAIIGFGAWVLHVLQAGNEQHSYAPGAPPPEYVRIEAGHTYSIAIPGGVAAEKRQGLVPMQLACRATALGQTAGALEVTAEDAQTKATNQIGRFTAALTATVHIDCTGLGAVYVDDAADAGTDWSLALVVLAAVALAVGLPLTLAGLRELSDRPLSGQPPSGWPLSGRPPSGWPREEQQVE